MAIETRYSHLISVLLYEALRDARRTGFTRWREQATATDSYLALAVVTAFLNGIWRPERYDVWRMTPRG